MHFLFYCFYIHFFVLFLQFAYAPYVIFIMKQSWPRRKAALVASDSERFKRDAGAPAG